MLGLQSMTDVAFGQVQARAYNDWCAEHLKGGEGRLFGAGALPPVHHPDDVPGVVDEIHHVAELDGGREVLDIGRNDHQVGHDAVVGGVGGVQGPHPRIAGGGPA